MRVSAKWVPNCKRRVALGDGSGGPVEMSSPADVLAAKIKKVRFSALRMCQQRGRPILNLTLNRCRLKRRGKSDGGCK